MVGPAPLPFVLGIGLNNLFTTDACDGRGLILGFNRITLASPPWLYLGMAFNEFYMLFDEFVIISLAILRWRECGRKNI